MSMGALTARDRDMVPPLIRSLLLGLLAGAGLISAPDLGRTGPLPMTVLLDGWIILLVVWMLGATVIRTTGVLLILSAYTLTRVLPALINVSPAEDFLQAYRWLFYLLVLALAVGKKWPDTTNLARVTWLLISLAILKGLATRAILGPEVRPGLLLENNFEIPLFAGVVAVLYRHLGRYRSWSIVAVLILAVIAGSRSGVIASVVLAIYAMTQNTRANLLVRFLAFLCIPAVGAVAYTLFADRLSPDGRIDRLNFLEVFIDETRDWGLLEWLVGTTPITPLSRGGCSVLSYYQSLFASTGDGSCYSVILHAFLMRVIFDAGVVGLVLAFGLLWYLMHRAKVQKLLTFTLLAIAVSNSASVSGPNNPYVFLPILMAVLLAHLPSSKWLDSGSVKTWSDSNAAVVVTPTRGASKHKAGYLPR